MTKSPDNTNKSTPKEPITLDPRLKLVTGKKGGVVVVGGVCPPEKKSSPST